MKVTFFPYPFSGETLYSICARYSNAIRIKEYKYATKELLECATAGRYVDIPYKLCSLESASGGVIAANEYTCKERTGISPYLALMEPSQRIAFLRVTHHAPAKEVRARSGLTRYRTESQVLKFCHKCSNTQEMDDGTTWWVASHQLPGVWHCPEHRVLLTYIHADTRRAGCYSLPGQRPLEENRPSLSVDAELKLWRLSKVIHWFAGLHHADTSVLQVMLKSRLHSAGLSASEVKWRGVERAHMQTLAHDYISDLQTPDVQQLMHEDWIAPLMRDTRHYDPLRWALAISWHGSIDEAVLARDYFDARARKPERDMFNTLSRTSRRSAAPRSIYLALEQADRKAGAVSTAGVTVYELDRWLRSDPSLRKAWRSAARKRAETKCVHDIKEFLKLHPRALRVDVLRECCGACRWLEENNSGLLQRLLPWPVQKLARQLSLPLPDPDDERRIGEWQLPQRS